MLTSVISRLCPMLNGTMKTDTSMAEHGGFGAFNGPSNAGSP
jgi:transcription initiation factor TFIID subunit 1